MAIFSITHKLLCLTLNMNYTLLIERFIIDPYNYLFEIKNELFHIIYIFHSYSRRPNKLYYK